MNNFRRRAEGTSDKIINGYTFINMGLPSGTLFLDNPSNAGIPFSTFYYFGQGSTNGGSGMSPTYPSGQQPPSGTQTLSDSKDPVTARGFFTDTHVKSPTKTLLEELFSNSTLTYNGSTKKVTITSNINGNEITVNCIGALIRLESSTSIHGNGTMTRFWSRNYKYVNMNVVPYYVQVELKSGTIGGYGIATTAYMLYDRYCIWPVYVP